MHNENLFDKIRKATREDTSEPGDWDAEQIWAEVVSRQKKSVRRWSWVPYVAAASIVLTGFFVWLNVKESDGKKVYAARHWSHIQANRPVFQVKEKDGNREPAQIVHSKKDRLIPVHLELAAAPQLKKSQTSQPQPAMVPDSSMMAQSDVPKPSENVDSMAENPERKVTIREKVLVADIDLPENPIPSVQLTSLQVMFRQAKKEREARKLHIKYQKAKVPGLWSFVHHSFSETP